MGAPPGNRSEAWIWQPQSLYGGELKLCFEGESRLGCEIHVPSRRLRPRREAWAGEDVLRRAYLLGSGGQYKSTLRATGKMTSQYHLMTTAVQRPALMPKSKGLIGALGICRREGESLGALQKAQRRLSPRNSWRKLPTQFAQAGKKRATR
jgi:hypothetical protein